MLDPPAHLHRFGRGAGDPWLGVVLTLFAFAPLRACFDRALVADGAATGGDEEIWAAGLRTELGTPAPLVVGADTHATVLLFGGGIVAFAW